MMLYRAVLAAFFAAVGFSVSASAASKCQVIDEKDGQTHIVIEIEKGTAPNEPKNPTLLVFECNIPKWEKFDNVNLAVWRDNERSNKIGLFSVGTQNAPLKLKFQFIDEGVTSVADHSYVFDAKFRFLAPQK